MKNSQVTRRGFTVRAAAGASIAAVVGAAGCGRLGDQGTGRSQRKPVTVRFLTNWATGARLEALQKALPEFGRQFPHITVEFEPKDEGMYTMLIAHAAAGTLPHVALGAGEFFHEVQDKGLLLDITSSLRKLRVNLADYTLVPGTADLGGKRYGMPFQLVVGAWLYNKALFQAEGLAAPSAQWTWNDLLDAARKLTKSDKGQWGIQLSNNIQAHWGPFILANGEDHWISADFKKTLLDRPAAVEAIQFAVDLIYRHRVAPTPQEVSQQGVGFGRGNVAMTPVNSGSAGSYRGPSAAIQAGFFPWTQSPRTRRSRTFFNDQPHWVMSSATDRVDEATQLAVFLAGDFTQGLIADLRGSTPVLKKIQTSDRYLSPPPDGMRVIVESIPQAVPHPFNRRYQQWVATVQKAMDPAFAGGQAAAEAAREATRLGDQVLAAPPA